MRPATPTWRRTKPFCWRTGESTATPRGFTLPGAASVNRPGVVEDDVIALQHVAGERSWHGVARGKHVAVVDQHPGVFEIERHSADARRGRGRQGQLRALGLSSRARGFQADPVGEFLANDERAAARIDQGTAGDGRAVRPREFDIDHGHVLFEDQRRRARLGEGGEGKGGDGAETS